MQKNAEFFTVDDLLVRWGGVIAKGTLANWRAKRIGPAYVKIGGRILYPVSVIETWEKTNMKFCNDNSDKIIS